MQKSIRCGCSTGSDLGSYFLLKKERSAWEDLKPIADTLKPPDLVNEPENHESTSHEWNKHLRNLFVHEGQLLSEFKNLAAPFYRRLWIACSRDEKLLLYQMANGDLANIGNGSVIKSLEARGLIIREPELAIANRSFAQFVLTAETRERIDLWRERLPKGSWSVVRMPLVILLVSILILVAYAAGDIFQAALGLGPVLIGAIPILLQYLPRMRHSAAVDQSN